MAKVAVLFAGCGYLDGAEIRESVFSILALDMLDVEYEIFSIDMQQHHVVNHLTGEESDETRNMLVESARIARGDVKDISALNVDEFDGLLLPGGFGVAINFCTFAFKGHNAEVNPHIKETVQSFHKNQKPIGAICIAPVLMSLILGENEPTLTIGTDENTASEMKLLGANHQNCATTDCVIDEQNKIVTTPAYMDDTARIKDVYAGITNLVTNLVQLIKS